MAMYSCVHSFERMTKIKRRRKTREKAGWRGGRERKWGRGGSGREKEGERGGRHTGLTRFELRLLVRLLVSGTSGSRSPVVPYWELTCFGEPRSCTVVEVVEWVNGKPRE